MMDVKKFQNDLAEAPEDESGGGVGMEVGDTWLWKKLQCRR